MAISGTLEAFSLPEVFQIIESGHKSGMLTFKSSSKDLSLDLNGTFELWFEKGNFISIINSLDYQFLINEIIKRGWIDARNLFKTTQLCPTNQALGTYIKQQQLLNESQIDSLFKMQTDMAIKLFNVDRGWFRFEDLEQININTKEQKTFPWSEMTGQKKKATELSLEAMRIFSNWSRFTNEMPAHNCGLQRLINHCNLHFNSLEEYLCNTADGSISLHKIAQKMEVSIERVQRTALSMILAGLLEEVPEVSLNVNMPANNTFNQPSNFTEAKNISVKTKKKSKVSNSLINNLANFLKSNF